MHPRQEPPTGSGDLVYDVDSELTIATDGAGRVWAYDLETDTWTEKTATVVTDDIALWFYDPFSGQVVSVRDDGNDETLGFELASYDVDTDAWTTVVQAKPLAIGPHFEFLAYDPSVDRMVAYTNAWGPPDVDGNRLFVARMWLLDIQTGDWSESSAVAPGFSAGLWGHVPAIAYDEASRRIVMLGQGHSAAYDATADHWEILNESAAEAQLAACAARPECRQLHRMAYDPVNKRLVVFGGFVATTAGESYPDDVLAFDTQTREWTVLLASSNGQMVPGQN